MMTIIIAFVVFLMYHENVDDYEDLNNSDYVHTGENRLVEYEPGHDDLDNVQGDIIEDLNFLFGDLFLWGIDMGNNNNIVDNELELEFLFRKLNFH
jgi:hypothetical protein